MMEPLHFRGDVLDCTFYKKVNVIGGTDGFGMNSGMQKTHLFNSLQDGINNGVESCNYRVVFLSGMFEDEILDINEPLVYVVDEMNLSLKKNTKIFRSVEGTNKYLIAIGRLFIPQLQYSIDSIYSIDLLDNKFYLKNSIGFESRNRMNEIYSGITEDNENTALFYNRLLRDFDVNATVVPACGKDKVPRLVWAMGSLSKVFLIVDNPKFGSILMRIIERIDNNNVNSLLIFAPDCFEELLLGFFDSEPLSEFVSNGIPLDDIDDAETVCEHLIRDYLPVYSKKSQTKFWDYFYSSELVDCFKVNPIIQILEDLFTGNSSYPMCEKRLCFELDVNTIHSMKKLLNSYKSFNILASNNDIAD